MSGLRRRLSQDAPGPAPAPLISRKIAVRRMVGETGFEPAAPGICPTFLSSATLVAIDPIAEKHSDENVEIYGMEIADPNFGMYRRDKEICEILRGTQDKFGYPKSIGCSTGKNKADVIIENVGVLETGSLILRSAMQSMNDVTLAAVKRQNIKMSAYEEIQKDMDSKGLENTADLMLGLPLETKQTHMDGVFELINLGVIEFFCLQTIVQLFHRPARPTTARHTVETLVGQRVFALALGYEDLNDHDELRHDPLFHVLAGKLEELCAGGKGTELDSQKYIRDFGIERSYRLIPECEGDYEILGEKVSVYEIEEIIVGINTLTFDDYLECRKLHLLVMVYHNTRLLSLVYEFFDHLGIQRSEIVKHLFATKHAGLVGLLDDFLTDTKSELRDAASDFDGFDGQANVVTTCCHT